MYQTSQESPASKRERFNRYLQMTNTANEPIAVPLVTNRNLEPLENSGL